MLPWGRGGDQPARCFLQSLAFSLDLGDNYVAGPPGVRNNSFEATRRREPEHTFRGESLMKLPAAKLSAGRGFTLVELLIVIAIIGTLVGLLLPAVNAARARARQAQCLNNISELGKAMSSYTTSKNEFPGLIEYQRTTIPYAGFAALDGVPATNNVVDLALPWPARLLADLDQAGLSEQLLTNNGGAGLALANSESIYRNPPRLEIFICPSDEGTNTEVAKISYVGNAGYFDRTAKSGGNQINDVKANGIFHDQRYPGAAHVKLGADIKDGGNSTMLISENVHRDETINGDAVTWLNPVALDPQLPNLGLNVEQIYGMVWDYDTSAPGNPSTQAPLNRADSSVSDYASQERFFARPASSHPEVFNVLFVGGNAKAVNQGIEYRVYQQLMTPNGAKAKALDYTGNDGPERMRQFMNPPLKESDY